MKRTLQRGGGFEEGVNGAKKGISVTFSTIKVLFLKRTSIFKKRKGHLKRLENVHE